MGNQNFQKKKENFSTEWTPHSVESIAKLRLHPCLHIFRAESRLGRKKSCVPSNFRNQIDFLQKERPELRNTTDWKHLYTTLRRRWVRSCEQWSGKSYFRKKSGFVYTLNTGYKARFWRIMLIYFKPDQNVLFLVAGQGHIGT